MPKLLEIGDQVVLECIDTKNPHAPLGTYKLMCCDDCKCNSEPICPKDIASVDLAIVPVDDMVKIISQNIDMKRKLSCGGFKAEWTFAYRKGNTIGGSISNIPIGTGDKEAKAAFREILPRLQVVAPEGSSIALVRRWIIEGTTDIVDIIMPEESK